MKINGKKVVDARKPIVLTVNASDVAHGQTKAPDACAIARACMRQRAAKSARVHVARTYIEYPDKWVRYRTSQAARTEIVSFDRGHKFTTGEYVFHPVPSSNRPGGRRQGSTTGDKRTRAERKKGKKRCIVAIKGVRASAKSKNVWSR